MYGYLDESGAPGKATRSNDFLLLCLVIFSSKKLRDDAILGIRNLRRELKLPDDFEFHCSRNSAKIKDAFFKFLAGVDFKIIRVIIQKDSSSKTASYSRISSMMITEIQNKYQEIKIEMDSNPSLYAHLRRRIRERGLSGIKLRERNSRHVDLIQVADYIANITAKNLRNPRRAHKWYRLVSNKFLPPISDEQI